MKDLSPERWLQIEALLDQVLDLPAEQRTRFIDQACADDSTLREQLYTVLKASHQIDDFLEQPEGIAALLHDLPSAPGPLGGSERAYVGRYRIIRPIGRGGMAQVYLARRDDETFKRYVALKVIRRGMDTEDILRRFRTERQILASLNHPNIARLLDGGATDDGISYFVMEYIDGMPLTTYCDQHRLSVDARLQLFQTVCSAVHYAHQNLIVHRDLKPSNIMVTSEGTIKLLDFGIAKLLNPDLAGYSVPMTRTEVRVMTPEYASPEQVRGQTITTASDIYSLGVLLYELLAGHPPYQLSGRGPLELERIICEIDPELPSTAISHAEEQRSEDGTTTTITPEAVSQARNTPTDRLRRRLAGDLDKIVLKALRKEPERRYRSAEAFLEDIKRHLEGLPVQAQRATMRYRTKKFIQRHRLGVAAASALVGLLLLVVVLSVRFAVVTATQSKRIEVQAERIELEAAKTEEVKDFLIGLFEESDPANARGEKITAREMLDRGVEQIEALEDQPEVQAEMLFVMGGVYQHLGSMEQAKTLLERSLALRREFYGQDHEEIAQTLNHLGGVQEDRGAYDQAERLYREALAMQQKLLGPNDPEIATTLDNLGGALVNIGSFDEAEILWRDALNRRQALFGQEHEDIAESMINVAWLLHEKGNYDEAERFYRSGLAMQQKLLGPDHPDVSFGLNNLGALLYDKGAYDDAEPIFREALALRRKLFGEDHARVASSMNWLGRVLYEKGQLGEAEPLFRESLALHRKTLGEQHPVIGRDLNFLARLQHRKGLYREAEQHYLESIDVFDKTLPTQHPYVALAHIDLGNLYLDQDRPVEAEAHLREALRIRQALYEEANTHTAQAQLALGSCLTALRRYDEAETLLLAGYAVFKNEDTELPEQARQALFDLYTAWGKPEQAAAYRAR